MRLHPRVQLNSRAVVRVPYGGRAAQRTQMLHAGRMKPIDPNRAQPSPLNPGVSKHKVRQHAQRLFRDTWERRALTPREWRLAEEDLLRRLEAESL